MKQKLKREELKVKLQRELIVKMEMTLKLCIDDVMENLKKGPFGEGYITIESDEERNEIVDFFNSLGSYDTREGIEPIDCPGIEGNGYRAVYITKKGYNKND